MKGSMKPCWVSLRWNSNKEFDNFGGYQLNGKRRLPRNENAIWRHCHSEEWHRYCPLSLENTIKEIEVSASEKFLHSFTEIRTNFAKVFRSLFSSDDNCDLILEDPSNPLESNIQIIAKTEGKTSTVNQSTLGWWKNTNGHSIIVCTVSTQAAPFCIFDEVDAPLDDANIEEFNNIIKEFSSESQFVIVTHNKSTMAAVDIIYGVYMPELGIPSVTPVDFRSLETVAEKSTIY